MKKRPSKRRPVTVLAFGGNAILPARSEGTQEEQERCAAAAARHMADFVAGGSRLVVVHGNGPQAGNELLRSEESITKLPPVTLDYCVAKTKGEMGYMLETALRNELARRRMKTPVVTVLTSVRVNPKDPAFRRPVKPIGPYYTSYRARVLRELRKWPMIEVPGRGWRRVVASPKPLKILDAEGIEKFLDAGYAVVAGGGGGIPVVRERGRWRGVEAVVDKDLTAALLANLVGASRLVIFTEVAQVALHFGTPHERKLLRLTAREAARYMREGHFPPGSMGPKIEASLAFVRSGPGREALITSASAWPLAREGRSGTRITR
jgi:carbamate kinase